MTERIERVKDALGMGSDRSDAGRDADRHDVERVEGESYRADEYPTEQYRADAYDGDPADPATRHVDPAYQPGRAEPAFDDLVDAPEPGAPTAAAAGPTASERMAADPMATDRISGDPMAGDRLANDRMAADPMSADPVATDPVATDPVATGDTWAASDSPAEAGPSAADESAWRDLQARFVDEPEAVTREAGAMVDQAVARLTQALAAAGGDGSTESLRHAFRRYREVYRTLTEV